MMEFKTGKKELVFALAALICGFLLCNFTLYGGFQLGFAIAVCLSILCAAGYLLAAGCRPGAYSVVVLLLSISIAAGFGRSDDGFVKFVLFSFLLVGAGLGLAHFAGKNRFAPGKIASLGDAFCVLFGHSIGGSAASVRGLAGVLRRGGEGVKKGGALLLGLAIAAPVLVVTVFLLGEADAAFQGVLELLPEFDGMELFVTLHLGVVAGLLLYAMAVSLNKKSVPAVSETSRSRGLNPITVNTVLGCLCAVYGVYLVSQLAYFSGGFSGILPEGFSVAEYARRGFFEMALLCGINLLIIALMLGLVKKEATAPLSTRLLCLFIGLVTLFLIVSASAKMSFYIENYGLSRLRVLTQLVMLFLGLTIVVVIAWMFLPKLPYMKAVVVIALTMGALTIWLDVDTQVAQYNVDAYLFGKLETVDVYYLSRLNSGAVEHIARLAEQAQDPEIAQQAEKLLYNRDVSEDFRSWNYCDASTAKYKDR